MANNLVYIGRVQKIDEIPGADRIVLATVYCGHGGIWRGVIARGTLTEGDLCMVYLPDSVLPQIPEFDFMKPYNYIIKPRRFKGARSECLITPLPPNYPTDVGTDVTEMAGVKKHDAYLSFGEDALGVFPAFIPKTDEPHFQSVPEMVEELRGNFFYSTVKMNGASTTVYRYRGHFGVCSRTLELREGDSVYWACAKKYDLPKKLHDGMALQFETVGPGIKKNTAGIKEIEARVFDVYFIEERRYAGWTEISDICNQIGIPTVPMIDYGKIFDMTDEELIRYAEGTYEGTNRQREGVVIRHINPNIVFQGEGPYQGRRVSFKVINLKH